MKIELGKYYRTQEGLKAGPAEENQYNSEVYPFNVPVHYDYGKQFHGYTKGGESIVSVGYNLVSEWFDIGDRVYNEFYGGQYGTVVGFEDDYILVVYDKEFCSIWKGHKWLTRPEEIVKVSEEEEAKEMKFKVGDKVGSTYIWDREYQYGVVTKVEMRSNDYWITTDWLDNSGGWARDVGYYSNKLYLKEISNSKKKQMHPDEATQAIKDFLEDNGFAFCTLSFETQDGAYYHAD